MTKHALEHMRHVHVPVPSVAGAHLALVVALFGSRYLLTGMLSSNTVQVNLRFRNCYGTARRKERTPGPRERGGSYMYPLGGGSYIGYVS